MSEERNGRSGQNGAPFSIGNRRPLDLVCKNDMEVEGVKTEREAS